MLNVNSWKELKRELRKYEGKTIFILERTESMNDGKFIRILHKVKPHELVFSDGKQLMYLSVDKEQEDKLEFFENGFKVGNCSYTLDRIME